MTVIREFSSESNLVNYLRLLMADSYTPDDYYQKLEELANDGCYVRGKQWEYLDLCEML